MTAEVPVPIGLIAILSLVFGLVIGVVIGFLLGVTKE